MSIFDGLLGNGKDRPPAPEVASAEDLERYTMQWYDEHGPFEARTDTADDGPTMSLPFAKELDANTKHKAQYPWLYEPEKGVRWDFDPIQLRNLGQGNTWVGMLVQTITKEVSETPWTIVRSDGRRAEQRKRLDTHPDRRTPVAKADTIAGDLPDDTAEAIAELLMSPTPDINWHDYVEMTLGDLLEVGSASTVKAFDARFYEGEDLAVDAADLEPHALQPQPPEVWTKDFHGKTGVLDGFWQFDHNRSPGAGTAAGGTTGTRGYQTPIHFDTGEMMWSDMSPRTNRRYGMPPTLLVRDFLESLDLAIKQEQNYLSRGSTPSGALVFENYDREHLKEMKTEFDENVKGKPHKILMLAGRGENVNFEKFSYNFKELQFTERMKWYARVIASAFQVPTAVVGIEPERVNYNTFQGERENFEENTLGPYLMKLERFINADFIRPHWGDEYHFEFKPGISESTRGMISERVRAEWNANLIQRGEALQELGKDLPDDAEDGYKADVVEDGGDGGPFDNIEGLQQALTKQDGEFTADVFGVVVPAEDAEGFEDRVVGIGVDFPNDAVYVDWRNEVFPDELENSHVSIYGTVDDLEQATGNLTVPIEAIDAVNADEVAAAVSKAIAKDEPLRETDAWYQFDVQPHMIDDLHDAIGDDVRELFEAVTTDDEIQAIIERLAADAEAEAKSDGVSIVYSEKSLNDLTRRLREILSQTRISGAIADAIRTHSADAIRDTLEDTIADAEGTAAADVDIERVTAQLQQRDVAFADRFVDEMAADIRETVGDGWAEGKNSREIAQDLAEQADMNEGWTGAERIARQELHVATGEARSAVADDLNKVEVWSTAGDDRVRDAHADMDGLWKRPGDEWVVEYERRGVQKESVPGDSEPGIGCRCTTLLRDVEEVDSGDYAGDGAMN
jgi:hypothetical protein